jgi:hypothetical protein
MGGINGLSASSTLDIVLSFMYQVEEWDNENWRTNHFNNLTW